VLSAPPNWGALPSKRKGPALAWLEQVGREAVAQRMQRHALLDPGRIGRLMEQAAKKRSSLSNLPDGRRTLIALTLQVAGRDGTFRPSNKTSGLGVLLYMKRLSPSLPDHTKRSVRCGLNLRIEVGTHEPNPFCGKQNGSRAAHGPGSRVHGGALLRMWNVHPALP
jgi:hypothetical protein